MCPKENTMISSKVTIMEYLIGTKELFDYFD